jgi:hypothetical protein
MGQRKFPFFFLSFFPSFFFFSSFLISFYNFLISQEMMTALKKLCTPAYLYLVVSLLSVFVMLVQNVGNTDTYCVGNYECIVPSTIMVFAVKFFYIAVWTFILNSVCKAGYENVSWIMLLFPFILFFVLIGLYMLHHDVY